MKLAPIILFVYNRPEHTRKTVEALQKNELASESVLYVFSDGPKENADKETLDKISAVRNYIHTVTGFKEIIITERDKNKGLDPSVIDGVTEVLKKHGKCIVLEDDIVTHSWFLRYMNECLDKFEEDKRIWQIGGFINNIKFPWWNRKDVVMIPRVCSWGWAIWKDRWEQIEWSPTDITEFKDDLHRVKNFCRGGNDLLPMLISQFKQTIPAWDITFQYTLSNNYGYVVMPVKSLTFNIGCDGTGIHCGNVNMADVISPFPTERVYNLNIPSRIKQSWLIEKRYKEYQDHIPPFCLRIKNKMRSLISRFL